MPRQHFCSATYSTEKLLLPARTHPFFAPPPPKNRFQSIVEQSFNPGLSSQHTKSHPDAFCYRRIPRLVFPLSEAPMVLFQSSCSGRRSKREEARGFMKAGHYSLQQVIVPPTEQMKSRDVLGISIATPQHWSPASTFNASKIQSFTRSFTGVDNPKEMGAWELCCSGSFGYITLL